MMSEERKQRNKENLGTIFKNARTKAGFTQKALADALGLEYYTMISQMELGYISIPASLWSPIADTLRMDKSDWVLKCLNEYVPDIYKALFDHRGRREVALVLNELRKGNLDYLSERQANGLTRR